VIRWKLNEVMSQQRLRNKDLAEALGITENSAYRLRKSEEMPRLTPQRLEGICQLLQCQPGDLLEWAAPSAAPWGDAGFRQASEAHKGDAQSVLVERNPSEAYKVMAKAALQRLTAFHAQILALSWRGYKQYGPGVVVFTDLPEGAQIAYLEKAHLADLSCQEAVERNRPELSAVVLYYQSSDYSGSDYEILTLTGPRNPPEYYRVLSNSEAG
jgi:putative transcriptional regulator